MKSEQNLNRQLAGSEALVAHVAKICDAIESRNGEVAALIEDSYDRNRVIGDIKNACERWIDAKSRPRLFGVTFGVKDIIRVDGYETRCGSQVPAQLFAGNQASCVTRLLNAGAIFMGKTETTEFAYLDPGPTRNPHNLNYTPGGSSSGSAAGVAAGFFDLSLGTQTVGSVMRPAAYCGILAFKPTIGRVPTDGVVPFSVTVDQLGYFCREYEILNRASEVLVADWRTLPAIDHKRTTLGVPTGPYLEQTSRAGLDAFKAVIERLKKAGCQIKNCDTFSRLDRINNCHQQLIAADMAGVHRDWFKDHSELYRPKIRKMLELGMGLKTTQIKRLRQQRLDNLDYMIQEMDLHEIDYWLSPGATDTAGEGLDSTGSPVMNLPWTHVGMPVLSLPTGRDDKRLPYAIQVTGRLRKDEELQQLGSYLESRLGYVY